MTLEIAAGFQYPVKGPAQLVASLVAHAHLPMEPAAPAHMALQQNLSTLPLFSHCGSACSELENSVKESILWCTMVERVSVFSMALERGAKSRSDCIDNLFRDSLIVTLYPRIVRCSGLR